jgi:hypothetical protein
MPAIAARTILKLPNNSPSRKNNVNKRMERHDLIAIVITLFSKESFKLIAPKTRTKNPMRYTEKNGITNPENKYSTKKKQRKAKKLAKNKA